MEPLARLLIVPGLVLLAAFPHRATRPVVAIIDRRRREDVPPA